MKKIKKKLITFILLSVSILGMSVTVNAESDVWDINYIPNAPASVSNQNDTLVLNYYSGGYYASCSYISGMNGRALTINSSSAGGMNTVYVTTKGRTISWKMKSSTSGKVTFKVSAVTGYTCNSDGTIYIND